MKKYEVKITDLFEYEPPTAGSWKAVYLASEVDARIAELEAALKMLREAAAETISLLDRTEMPGSHYAALISAYEQAK